MSIRDEARQEAERRWTRDIDVNNPLSGAERRSRRVGFELGARWASEKANREPSDAEQRLADVIEYTERQMGPPATDWEHDPAKILQTVARIARGENVPDSSERG